MARETMSDDASEEQITATIGVESVLTALKYNDTNGADDRVIAVPQKDGADAKVRRAFTGTERYSNPETAPVHIRPETLVEEGFTAPPPRHLARDHIRSEHDVPENIDEWSDEMREECEEAHDVQVEVWETDVRRMIEGEHELGGHKNVDITLVGEGDN